jgi:hypothetical protein
MIHSLLDRAPHPFQMASIRAFDVIPPLEMIVQGHGMGWREWTADWYRHDTYEKRVNVGNVSHNPKGPSADETFDPSEPGCGQTGAQGGSFLCTDQ